MYPEMHAITKMAKIRQNRQFRQDDFALTNLTKNHQNRQIHEHWLGLTIEKWRVALVSAKLNCQRAWLDRERYRFFCFLDSGVRKNRSQQLGNLTICSEVIVKRPAKGVGVISSWLWCHVLLIGNSIQGAWISFMNVYAGIWAGRKVCPKLGCTRKHFAKDGVVLLTLRTVDVLEDEIRLVGSDGVKMASAELFAFLLW